MTTDYGSDVHTPGGVGVGLDLDPWFTSVAGPEAVGEACVRRLVTARGTLIDDPEYGYDIRAHLNDHAPNAVAIEAAVVDQLLRDERVRRASARATVDPVTGALAVSLVLLLAEGTFRLVLAVSAVSVEVLATEAA